MAHLDLSLELCSSVCSLQVAGLPVSQCEEVSPEIWNSQKAVQLSVHQIEKCINGNDLVPSLPSLGKVQGWNAEQAAAIVGKLFHSGYQILDGQSLTALGSLVAGLNFSSLQAVPAQAVLEAIEVPSFAEHLEKVSPALKALFVEKLVAGADGFDDLVKRVPGCLVPYIPKEVLSLSDSFSIQDLNSKPWTPEQAAMLFDAVIARVSDFNSLSPFLLHGFTCAAAAKIGDEEFQQLAQAMKQKDVRLGEEQNCFTFQLSCLAKRIMLSGRPKNFSDYPKDLVLFLSPADYMETGNCLEYITRVGEANIEILEKGSPRRAQLLSAGLACLNISDIHVSQEDAEILGRLVCDLGPDVITASGKNMLKQLAQCQSFTPDQIEAIRAVLRSGNTPFGPPATWSSSTLEELSGLLPVFDGSILKDISTSVLAPWLKRCLQDSHLRRDQLEPFVKTLQPSRQKRSSECPADQIITEEVVKDELLPILYSVEDLRLCLKGPILVDNLDLISKYAFTKEQLIAIKENLDEMYPSEYPDSVLGKLGFLVEIMSPEDVKKWSITSADTLASLLKTQPTEELATAIIQRYIDLGHPLDNHALNGIGSEYLCLLTAEQLNKISEAAIRMANSLDPSGCSQSTKDILYPKAKRAFSDRHNEFPAYYNLIKPYLGGAPGVDLRALSKDKVNMDMQTFQKLRKDAVLDRVGRLVRSGGHQPLLVIHVGTNDVAKQCVGGITRDLEALGKKLRELKAQVAFSSILLVQGFGRGRDRRASEVNDWLRVWCQKERFGFLDHGTRFLANGLLARDGLHLMRMGKRSFGDALVSFVRKTLN
ncbi:Mesothelin [Varanus komodoensis]|nr:Mesothelin [Varanus komodoensis]